MPLISEGLSKRLAGALLLNFAAMVFLGVTFYLTWQSDSWEALQSLHGLGFIALGAAFSGIVIGALPAALHRRVAVALVARNQGRMDDRIASIVRGSGTLVLLLQMLAVYYLTVWCFERWITPLGT